MSETVNFGQHTIEWWEEFWRNHENSFGPPRDNLINHALTYAKRLDINQLTCIDIGSGNGRYAIPLAAHFDTTALEYTDAGIERIQSGAQEMGVTLNVVKADFILESKQPRQYDIVFSSGLLEEIDALADQLTVIAGLQNWTKPNGLLIFKFCLEIKDRGIRVPDGLVFPLFDRNQWTILEHEEERTLRDSLATINFENKLRTETIIAIKKQPFC